MHKEIGFSGSYNVQIFRAVDLITEGVFIFLVQTHGKNIILNFDIPLS